MRDLLRTVNWVCAIGFASICLVGLLVAPLLASHWIGDRALSPGVVVQSLFLMILVAALRVIEGVQRGALLGLHRHVLLNLLSIVTVTLRAGGVILPLALVSATPQMFFAWQAGVSVLSVLAFSASVHASLPTAARRARFDFGILRTLSGFAGGVLGATALGVLLTQVDKILLVNLVPLASFSAYALATAIAGGLYQIVTPVSQSYYPLLTSHVASGDPLLASDYHEGSQLASATVGPPAAILAFFAKPLLVLWTGDLALSESAAPVLSLLAVGTLCHCMMYMPYMLQLAAGWSSLAMRMNLIAVLIVFPTLLLVVPNAGMIGAAGTWVALNGATLIVTIRIMHRRLLPAEMSRWYRQDLLLPVVVAFGTAGVSRTVYPDHAEPIVQLLALAVACGVSLTSGALAASSVRQRLKALIERFVRS